MKKHLFVYGTLKKGFHNHIFLKDCKMTGHLKLKHYALVDLGHGFPYMIESTKHEWVYGEVYEVNRAILKKIDLLEGVPYHYQRQNMLLDTPGGKPINTYYYVSNLKDVEHLKVKDNYWAYPKTYSEVFDVIVDGREYSDTADKIVFHMRFFDGDRTPTNKDYMKLVKARSHLPINIDNENLFLLDCIHYGIVKYINYKYINNVNKQ